MALTTEEVKQIATQVSDQAAQKISSDFNAAEAKLNTAFEDFKKGAITSDQLEAAKKATLDECQKVCNELEAMKESFKTISDAVTEMQETPAPKFGNPEAMKKFIVSKKDELKRIKSEGRGHIEFGYDELKAAGVQTISGSVSPESPYLPGIGGTPLELFDIVRNENFMINRVDMGTANTALLAYINELPMEGTVGMNIPEGGLKNQVQHKFTVETSKAKKAAAYIRITDEFEEDLEALYNDLRGMLQADVIRAFDDQIQYDVQAVATPWNLPGMIDDIQDANLWDAVYALITQVGVKNFTSNTVAMNWLTNAKVQMGKDNTAAYLLPPFREEIASQLVRANKLTDNFALAGDLRQYRVRMLKGYTFKMGWINDDFIRNQFAILGEIRYHSFISENRKQAIVKGDLNAIRTLIDGTPGS